MSVKEIFSPTTEYFDSKRGVINLPNPGRSLSKSQRKYLNLAMRMAESSDVNSQHGAVVVSGGRVLALGVNRWRNRDMLATGGEYNPNITTHAEVDALSRVDDPRGATVYVARIGKHGEEKFSRPCDNCAKALIEAGVKAVVYTIG
jgi:deoxycytidylate deaminase